MAENFNTLVDTISSDSDWLLSTLRFTAENDHFTGKLVEIFKQVNEEGVKQKLRLGIVLLSIIFQKKLKSFDAVDLFI